MKNMMTRLLSRGPKKKVEPVAPPPPVAAPEPPPQKPVPKRFVTVDEDGHPIAFYSTDVHGDSIPSHANPLTEEAYARWHRGHTENPMRCHRLVGGLMVEHVHEPTLSERAVIATSAGLTVRVAGDRFRFPTDRGTLDRIGATVAVIAATGKLPGDAVDHPMKDADGAWRHLGLDEYRATAAAISSYVSTLGLIADGNPLGATELPPDEVTITL